MSDKKAHELRELFDRRGVIWGDPETYGRVAYKNWRALFEIIDRKDSKDFTPWERQLWRAALPMVVNRETEKLRSSGPLKIPEIQFVSDGSIERAHREMRERPPKAPSGEEIELRRRFADVDLDEPSTWTRASLAEWSAMRELLHTREFLDPPDSVGSTKVEWASSEPMEPRLSDWDRKFLDVSKWVEEVHRASRALLSPSFASGPRSDQAIVLLMLMLTRHENLVAPINSLNRKIRAGEDGEKRRGLIKERNVLVRQSFCPDLRGLKGSQIPEDWKLAPIHAACGALVLEAVQGNLSARDPRPTKATCVRFVRFLIDLGVDRRVPVEAVVEWRGWKRIRSARSVGSTRIIAGITNELAAFALNASPATIRDRMQAIRRAQRPARSASGSASDRTPVVYSAFTRWLSAQQAKIDKEDNRE